MPKKKLRYAVLKEVEKGINHRDLTHEDFSVTEKELYDCMEYLVDEKYVKGFIYADLGKSIQRFKRNKRLVEIIASFEVLFYFDLRCLLGTAAFRFKAFQKFGVSFLLFTY